MSIANLSAEKLALLLALSFFFGLAFEEYYAATGVGRPGGVRTFPLLTLSGAGLYAINDTTALPFAAGLLVLGAWLFAYYRANLKKGDSPDAPAAELMAPVCCLLAYLLGPIALAAPAWVAVGYAVAGVLLLWSREPLHRLARTLPPQEITTLGKFLILTGVVLPLLPNQPVIALTPITPYQVWLAAVAVSAVSYASYLVQRYVSPARGGLLSALLGGLYSSTATTVVLARQAHAKPASAGELGTRVTLATAVMYLRLGVVIAVFNLPLALALAPYLAGLLLLSLALAALVQWSSGGGNGEATPSPANPLELSTALIFAAIFVLMSLASAWVQLNFGAAGQYWLAAVVGVSDIDPFVLSMAEGAAHGIGMSATTVAILIAASSNNLLKLGYAVGFAGWRTAYPAAAALALLAAAGGVCALWLSHTG